MNCEYVLVRIDDIIIKNL